MNWTNILEYRPEHQPYFESLNRSWIEKYFELEGTDAFVLGKPEEAIIKPGGAILMAEFNCVPAGTVALRKVDHETYEFTKMAVLEQFRRRGIAEKLCYAALKKAEQLHAKKIILYTHSSLRPAIALYEKIGFKHIALEPGTYKRADIKMAYQLHKPDTNHKLMAVKIIRADESFAAAIASIAKRSFSDAFEKYFPRREELIHYLETTFDSEKIARSIAKENNVYLVALANNIPVGFAKFKKFSLNKQIESSSQMELQKLYVLSQHHGTGAGSALMKAVLNMAREEGPEYIWLDTLVTNFKAIQFYERRGFKKVGKLSFRIGSQIFDYHLMSLPIGVTETVQY